MAGLVGRLRDFQGFQLKLGPPGHSTGLDLLPPQMPATTSKASLKLIAGGI